LKKRWWLLVLIFVMALTMSACGSRLGANSWPGVSVLHDTAYVSAGPAIYALDVNSGDIQWAFVGEGKSFSVYAPPAVSEAHNLLVVGDYGGVLYALTLDGQSVWAFSEAESHYVASPLITEDAVYAPNADGNLYALDLNGQKRWVFEAGQPLWGTPVFDGEFLYVPSLGHHLYAINAADGTVVWDVDLGGALASQPTLHDGVVYVGTFANDVAAVEAATGQILWRAPATGWVWSAPAYADGTLFVGDLEGKFFALDAETGQPRWTETPDGPIVGQPAVSEGNVYFTSEQGLLLAFTTDGKPLWQHTLQGQIYAPPVLSESGLLLVAPYQGENLVVAVTQEGRTQWALSTKAAEEALKAQQSK